MPTGCQGFPPKADDYTGGRLTVGVYDHNSEPFEVKDNWLLEPNPTKPTPHFWTGTITFYLRENADGKELHAPPPSTGVAGDSSRETGVAAPTKPTRKASPGEIYDDGEGTRWKGDAIGRWYKLDEWEQAE